MKRYLEYLLFVLMALLLVACGGNKTVLHGIDDLNGSRIAVLSNAVSDKDFEKSFPESDASHFKSSSEFLLALAIGKCNAGIVERQNKEPQHYCHSSFFLTLHHLVHNIPCSFSSSTIWQSSLYHS